ncbi:hypothetical protein WDU94_011576 [Cyamophila willieti]
MSFFPKSLKREATNFICRNLNVYPPKLFQDLPNNLKTMLLEQILRMKSQSHWLKCQQQLVICHCQYCKKAKGSNAGSHVKEVATILINPDILRLIWTLEDLSVDYALITKCKNLKTLELYLSENCCNILTFPSCGLFSMFPRLMSLKLNVEGLSSMLVTDEVVFTLRSSCPQLLSLSLEGCVRLTDQCMEAVSQFSHMASLNLSRTHITDAAFVNIRPSSFLFTSLAELKLQDCLYLTNGIVKCFLIKCPNLILLNCLGCTRLSNFEDLFECNPKLHIYFTFDF